MFDNFNKTQDPHNYKNPQNCKTSTKFSLDTGYPHTRHIIHNHLHNHEEFVGGISERFKSTDRFEKENQEVIEFTEEKQRERSEQRDIDMDRSVTVTQHSHLDESRH